MRDQIPGTSGFFFQFSICHITLPFPSMFRTFLLFVTIAVNCRSRNIESNLMHKVNYCYYHHFRPGIYAATWKCRGLAFSRTRSGGIVKIGYLENYLVEMTDNVVMSRQMLLCMSNETEEHMIYGELVGTRECIVLLYPWCIHFKHT